MAFIPVGPVVGVPGGDGLALGGPSRPGHGFGKVIDHLLGQVNAQQASANQGVRDLALGQTDNLHGVMLAVAQADLSVRLVLEIRNRLTEAYQEVMRMQV